MPVVKIITNINWVLISIYGAIIVYAFINRTGHSDAAGQGLEAALLGFSVFLLLLLVGLNLLPYQWTKISALVIGGLLLFWIYNHD